MDESQIDKLGSKMRDAYADVASEAPVPAMAEPRHPSRRLRKNRTFTRTSGRKAAPAPGSGASGFIEQHPVASLLIAAAVGYVLARL
jgi:ElaB/YqjD/DUF883 family membrane-anchored ribosome-binding protein